MKAVIVIGPTGSGKTALSHALAEKMGVFELVNLDAFQFYRGFDVGTAKPSLSERGSYCYHLLDILDPQENIDAQTFARFAFDACSEIISRGKIPLCVGGSGLYLRAFLHGLDDLPPRDENFRRTLREKAESVGWPQLHEDLRKCDPVRASELHPNDKTRIERALEVFSLTGTPMSALRSKTEGLANQETQFPSFIIQLVPEVDILKGRISERTSLMLRGWREEVKVLSQKFGPLLSSFHCMQAIGYKEVLEFNLSQHKEPANLVQLEERISTQTWQYAKKQLTWNAKEKQDWATKGPHVNEDLLELLNRFLV